MFNKIIENIKNDILDRNDYFSNGFVNAIQNAELGFVSSGELAIFPSDEYGNYFYIRDADTISLSASTSLISDSISSVASSINVVLVAVCYNADPDTLLENIIATIQNRCGDFGITFNSAITNSDNVIRTELQFMTDEQRQRALMNIPIDHTFVSISFTLSKELDFNYCIKNPCKTC